MIKEGIDALVALARTGMIPVVVDENHGTKRVVIGGSVVPIEKAFPPRDHHVYSLEEIVQLAIRYTDKDGTLTVDDPPEMVVWYDEDKVVLVFDNLSYRAKTATLTLEQSDPFQTLMNLACGKPWFEQKKFIRLLRIDLAGTLEPVVLLEKVRRVEFENGMITSGRVTRQQESLGKQITSTLKSDELPEEVILQVPVYSTFGETDRLAIRCAVEVDSQIGQFQLIPMPDELVRVQQVAVQSIAQRLKEGLPQVVPAYYGTP